MTSTFQQQLQQMKEQAAKDNAMLESMASALRSGLEFSFNREDMAALLDRLREDHVSHLVCDQH